MEPVGKLPASHVDSPEAEMRVLTLPCQGKLGRQTPAVDVPQTEKYKKYPEYPKVP